MIKKAVKKLLLLIFMVWLAGYGMFVFRVTNQKPAEPQKQTEAIVVLTGGKNRIYEGLKLFSQNSAPKLFITGVNESVTKNDITKIWSKKDDLPRCCIILGHKATTTLENAVETQNWITENKIKSIRMVTSAYHMDRAKLEFHNLMHDIEIIPHPVEKQDPPLSDIRFWKITFSEYNKIIFRYATLALVKSVFTHA